MVEQFPRKTLKQLSLILGCQPIGTSQTKPGVTPTLTVRLESLGGDIYEVPLSISAAKELLLALAGWEPLCDSMTGSADPRKSEMQ
jgi:hypothetical protein